MTVYGAGYPLGGWACMYPCRCYTNDVTTSRVRLGASVSGLGLYCKTLSFSTPSRFIPALSQALCSV